MSLGLERAGNDAALCCTEHPGPVAILSPVSEQLYVLQPPRLEDAAKSCPLLDNQADREAWVACCSKRFLRLARRIADGDAIAEDVLQESWIRVLTHVCEYRGGTPACSWVRTVVANCAKDHRSERQQARHRMDGAPITRIADSRRNPEALAQELELLGLLHAVVAGLPGKYREVYDMRYVQELSPSETAHRLGISKDAVATRLSRAVKMVKKSLVRHLNRGVTKHL